MTLTTRRARRRTGLLASAALLGGALTYGTTAQASSPNEGSVSDAATSASWGGGPFVAPNTTGTALDAPDCTAPQSCDDYTLHVSTPAGYGDTHSLKIDVAWPNTAADFDVYVLDRAGNTVATSASSADPEEVVLPPTTGTYTVRVVPFLPLGDSYTATAKLVDQPVPPPPGTQTPPGFTTYAAPAALPDSNDAGEPSIGSSWKSGATMYQSYLSTYKVTFDDSTTPATAHWTDASASAAKGCPQGGLTSLDPILFTDHATGRTFESQLSGQDSLTCWSDDDGTTWNPSTGGGIPSGVDHQTIGGGAYSANDPLKPVGDALGYPDAVYYCSQDIATAFCATSHDGGTTFGAGVPTYSLLDCGGLHGHVKVAPDGTAYLPNKACGSNAAVVVSTDGGASWTVDKVPGSSPSDADPSVGVGANGTAYFGYVGSDGKPAVAVSHDQGSTWSAPQTVGTEFGIKNAVFPAMVAGDDDRATLAFIGTPTGGNYQDTANFKGEWHLYLATTYDGGQSWVTSDATPNDPVQRGSICTGGTTCGNDRNLLDFIDVTVDKTGHVEAAFADGCIKTCVTDSSETSGAGPADARAAYATIARQSSGLGLFSAYDPKVNLKLKKQHVRENGQGRFVAHLRVKDNGSRAARDVVVRLSDDGDTVGHATLARLGAGHGTTLTFRWPATTGRHTITGVVDPRNAIAESDEADNKLVTHRRP
jgi:CARDB protein